MVMWSISYCNLSFSYSESSAAASLQCHSAVLWSLFSSGEALHESAEPFLMLLRCAHRLCLHILAFTKLKERQWLDALPEYVCVCLWERILGKNIET